MTNKHPVIKNILKRKNKNGEFGDGRKIALVLTGGMMSGVNGAGAMIALEKLGLSQAFDSIYTASAGFPNASYLLTDNTEVGTSIYYDDLRDENFINFNKIWHPINYRKAIKAIKKIKPVDYKKIWKVRTNLYLKLNNTKNETRYFDIKKEFSPKEYFKLLKTAISFPGITKMTRIKNFESYDGQIDDEDIKYELQTALKSDCSDILIIYNQEEQQLMDFTENSRIFEILPQKDIGRFETRSEILREAAEEMKNKILEIFS